MKNAKEILSSLVERAEKVIIELNFNEEEGIKLLDALKKSLSEKENVGELQELYDACVYNALATINTCPNQEKKNPQLLSAITDAKEEIKAIIEYM
ncbi:MAG: hypothetical protein IJD91_08250 [Clostridia bacterium]|nr:hypothetical protein [Clostridia bacterium]